VSSRRFIEAVEPVLTLMPTVPRPNRPVSLGSRLIWTFLAATVYLLLSVTPLYGIVASSSSPLFNPLVAIIFASTNGTLAQLGIGPIIIAGIIMELVAFSELMDVDLNDPKDQARFTALTKLVAIVIAMFEGAFILSTHQVVAASPTLAFVVWLQMLFGAIIVILLDDMVSKGWGIGSGISLFILISIVRSIFQSTFLPVTVGAGELLGIIPALIAAIYNAATTHALAPLLSVVYRFNLPGLVGLVSTIVLGGFIAYVELMEVRIPFSLVQYGGYKVSYPFKVMYVSVLPIIFTAYTVALIYNGLYFIWATYNPHNANALLNAIACIRTVSTAKFGTINEPCTSSLIYYFTVVPFNMTPQYIVVHILMYIALSIVFAYLWVNLAGLSAEDQARTMVTSGLSIPGFRTSARSLAMHLRRYVNSLTFTSGLLAGLIAALGDVLGVYGTGIGLILLVEIIIQYYTIAMQEQLFEAYPGLKRILGVE